MLIPVPRRGCFVKCALCCLVLVGSFQLVGALLLRFILDYSFKRIVENGIIMARIPILLIDLIAM